MSENSPLALDFSQQETSSLVLPRPPLLTSYHCGWNGIQLEHHCQPACEVPAITTSQQIISIRLSQTLNKLAVTRRDKLHCTTGKQKATVSIFPAFDTYKVSWLQEVEFIHLYLNPHLLNHTAYESMNPEGIELNLQLAFNDQLIHQLGLALKRELEMHGSSSRLYAESLSTFLSVHLLQNYSNRDLISRDYHNGLPKYKLQQVLDYIHAHLTEDISLDEIAQSIDMSRYYFVRSFKQAMGVTPYQYVLQQRIEQAKILLNQRHISIAQIALSCGFANQSHFNKAFRKMTGTTATAYRNATYL